MKIASWNVNSIKVRLPHLLAWLKAAKPDVVCLQETKTVEDNFPFLEIEAAGYTAAVAGQKTYNGVAILSAHPMTVTEKRLPGNKADEQARYVEAEIEGVRVASVYLPNGNPVGTEKFDYKLGWMERLKRHAEGLLKTETPFVLAGDFNVIPSKADVHDPEGWEKDALYDPRTRAKFRALLYLGLTDAFRTLHPQTMAFTYWDYQGGAWQRDLGLRIDHLLLSPQATDRLTACEIDKAPRKLEKPSDHTPVWCELGPEPTGQMSA
ncbi:MAG: exodeoxyribonuclease III [Alphaproteobacteria bacterium]|nr:exodeoxyribonuclease III [Alphaproteobacteria bacterium]